MRASLCVQSLFDFLFFSSFCLAFTPPPFLQANQKYISKHTLQQRCTPSPFFATRNSKASIIFGEGQKLALRDRWLDSFALNSLAQDVESTEDDSAAASVCELKLECISPSSASIEAGVSAMDPEILSEFLMETGALSVVIEDADEGTDREEPIFNQPSNDGESWYRTGSNAAGDNFWKRCEITAYYPADSDVRPVIDSVTETFGLPTPPRFTVNNLPDQDWIKMVQQGWPPLLIGDLLLRFPWHTEADVAAVAGEGKYEHELQLEGGMAFGTGEHATTQLCCKWLKPTVRRGAAGGQAVRVLDYGAGSGILGLAALRFGAAYAAGVEIDRDSILAAAANAAVNGLHHMRCYLPSAQAQAADGADDLRFAAQLRRHRERDARWAGIQPLPDSDQESGFDVTVANILAEPLRRLAPELARLTRPGGALGLSGVLTSQAESVIAAFTPYFEGLRVADELNGWVLITASRRHSG